jgi:hypothetical protein
MINPIDGKIKQVMQQGVTWLETRFKRWTRPATSQQVLGTLADWKRSKREWIAENMCLRQQLIVLERQVLVLLASRIRGWREALIVVRPDTLIGWHRLGFKLFWRRKARGRQGRPPIAAETIALIEEMAIHNRTWRTKRIQGELLKLGIKVSKETITKYMRRARKGCPRSNEVRPGRRSSRITRVRSGRAILCRRMTCSFERCLRTSSLHWDRARSCIWGNTLTE